MSLEYVVGLVLSFLLLPRLIPEIVVNGIVAALVASFMYAFVNTILTAILSISEITRDRLLAWSCDDLFAALVWANEAHYPRGLAADTAARRFAARAPLGEVDVHVPRCTAGGEKHRVAWPRQLRSCGHH
mgnify:CR=1 FL=1